jgi:hypothetical protein
MKEAKRKLMTLSEANLALARGGGDDIDAFGEGGSPLWGGGGGEDWIWEPEPIDIFPMGEG